MIKLLGLAKAFIRVRISKISTQGTAFFLWVQDCILPQKHQTFIMHKIYDPPAAHPSGFPQQSPTTSESSARSSRLFASASDPQAPSAAPGWLYGAKKFVRDESVSSESQFLPFQCFLVVKY